MIKLKRLKVMMFLTSIFLSFQVFANTKNVSSQFYDKIKSINEGKEGILIAFNKSSALYKIQKNSPQFSELKIKCEKLKETNSIVYVVSTIPSMEITNISN